ncbi:hypothetical protein M413DRAFT_27231 [Hebeloma cylindrosporum]|uniref:Uncharacterized protein n=1 Tax=Hebeloma cylindrosporum TaxID=76867 RepID=A0A0C2XXU1_HEBCY|nr:hypothetical protein M413DRAFT_27231 [Hebeloma cylindrosporum h7]
MSWQNHYSFGLRNDAEGSYVPGRSQNDSTPQMSPSQQTLFAGTFINDPEAEDRHEPHLRPYVGTYDNMPRIFAGTTPTSENDPRHPRTIPDAREQSPTPEDLFNSNETLYVGWNQYK